MTKKTLYTVSNAHLDTQWNWTIQDTIRDCVKNTLTQNFALFEKYPNYKFNFEGAFRYELAKEYYPELYEKLKQYVAEGRWNFAGSSWDACDANCPSSEAMMRQILLGNGFIEEEFGEQARSRDIFLPDCFGFRHSLPSIAHHMGLIGFSTQKLIWGVGTPRLHPDGSVTPPVPDSDLPQLDLARWRGPDGAEILASFREGDYTYNYDRDPDLKVGERYLSDIEHNEKYAGVPYRSMYYGAGDYGGSPTDGAVRMVEEAMADPNALYQVKSAKSYEIFEDLTEEEKKNIPVYDGGLLIPHGYGAMVSHTISKRFNRKNELLADAAEKANSIAVLLGGTYPEKRLREAWRKFLWHQFHDDLTGTSIGEAYTFSYNDYAIALSVFASELTAGVASAAQNLDTASGKGTPIAVFYPGSTARTEHVTLNWKTDAPFARVFDREGKELPSQCKKEKDGLTVRFLAPVKPVSLTLFDLVASDCPCALPSPLSISEHKLENERYLVEIGKDGDVSRIYDKSAKRELLQAPIRMEVMPDTIAGPYPSWEYDPSDFQKPFRTVQGTPKFEITECGSARVALRITRDWSNSHFVQTISLSAGGNRVDFDNQIEWQEKSSMLRLTLPTAVSNPIAEFDQGMGGEKCPNSTDNGPYYQYLVHQWADLTDKDGSFGVSLMNDCKYSMDKPDDSTLRLTLIRTPAGAFSPRSAQDFQDWGKNLFSFSIASHIGARDGIAAEAEAMNSPASAFFLPKHPGKQQYSLSLVSGSDPEHLIRCAKKEEKGDRLVVRVQETAGRTASATLTFPAAIRSAQEANGYETAQCEASFAGNTLSYTIGANSVKTFLITLSPLAQEKPSAQTALALPHDRKITTRNACPTEGAFRDDISIPAELWHTIETAGGVTFRLGDASANNATVCAGQVLTLPEGTERVSLLAVSVSGDRNTEWKLGDRTVSIAVSDILENVGTWDMIAAGTYCRIKHDEIGVTYSHTHDSKGDRLYLPANLFKYDIDVNQACTLTLPSDPSILVLAATALTEKAVVTAADLYDRADVDPAKLHRLTVIGGGGSGLYPEGRTVVLHVAPETEDGVICGWDGAEAINEARTRASLVIGNCDTTVSVLRKPKE